LTSKRYKIVVFVPSADAERLRQVMGEAGAGRLGNYSFASFTVRGFGRFRPEAGAEPAIGEVGKLEVVEEDRIETICDEDRLQAVLDAIRSAHPYEEPAIDVYPIMAV
jgi:hypothetical protein